MRIGSFALLLAIGCNDHGPPNQPPTDLTIVSPGFQPRREVRYALVKGTKTTLELSIESHLADETIQQAIPTIAFTFELAADDVSPDGRMKLRMTIVDATTRAVSNDETAAASISTALEPLKGVAVTATLAPDGRIADVAVAASPRKLPDAVAAQLGGMIREFEQIAMPLPTPPIGLGARWKSARVLEQSGMKLAVESTVNVTGLTGTKLAFAMTSQLSGAAQTVQIGGTPIEIKHIAGTASGHGTIDLATLAVDGEQSADLHCEMATQDQQASKIDIGWKLTMTAR